MACSAGKSTQAPSSSSQRPGPIDIPPPADPGPVRRKSSTQTSRTSSTRLLVIDTPHFGALGTAFGSRSESL
ncbi:MAG: hypothetical protein MUE47_00395 [Acidobacteria bacterium]|nr:hypothetical protein [Acidobacteriota bacterium]